MPSSMRFNQGCNSWCQIKYLVRALFVDSGSGGSVLSQRQLIVVSSPMPPDPVPFTVEPVTSQVKNVMGISKGSISFGVHVKDTRVGRGEDLEFKIACRNDTTVGIEQIQVKVKEVCECKTKISNDSAETTLVAIPNVKVQGGLDKKKKKDVEESKKAGTNRQQDNFLDLFSEITSNENIASLKIPEIVRDSYKGQLIHIRHVMIVKIKTGRGKDDPKVEIPLHIGSPAVETVRMPSVRLPPPIPTPSLGDDEVAHDMALSDEWAGAEKSVKVHAIRTSFRMGGSTTVLTNEETDVPILPLPVLPPPLEITLDHLFSEMVASVDDYDIVSSKIQDPDWKQLFMSLDPDGFGGIICHVNKEVDQPRIGSLIAPVINNGNFTCAHCKAALKSTNEWNRIAMVQHLLPFCVDLENGESSIRLELTDWENVVLDDDFKRAKSGTLSQL
uniref:Arrestin C-terminal-like domain-containing protein n=1 Tax=Trieres chinensis TaxID=1514140 RepID=A0A7S1ZE28_TRICV